MWKTVLLVLAGLAMGTTVAADAPPVWAHEPATALKKDKEKDNSSGGRGPAIVLIIRHGEKPDGSGDPNLSPRGFERAKALARVIPAHFPRPDFLFATKKSKGSVRPIETITPLSHVLGETINEDYADDEVAALAKEVLSNPKYNGKIVMIAWHHGKIPDLAKDLGASNAPEEWSGKTFDRVWQLTFRDGSVQFANLPENALPGDSK